MSGAWAKGSAAIGGSDKTVLKTDEGTTQLPATSNLTPIHKNMFDYYVVLDFEATCDDKVKWKNQEIIEFPSVLIDASATCVVSEFQRYIKPVYNPTLTPFCTDLTGIQQCQVDAATQFHQVLGEYLAWLESGALGSKRSFAIVTCGDWDLGTMLPKQLKLSKSDLPNNFVVPPFFQKWVNLKHVFQQVTGSKPMGMTGMLDYLKKPLLGRHHSGIDDCRNIGTVLITLLRQGVTVDYTGGVPPQQTDYWLGSGTCQLPPATVVPPMKDMPTKNTSATTATKAPSQVSQAVVNMNQELIPVPDRDPVQDLLKATACPTIAEQETIAISKKLAHALRHGALQMRLPMTSNGFVALDALLSNGKFKGVAPVMVASIVAKSDKQRYMMVYGKDGLIYIRANQGHSLEGITVDMSPITNPSQCPVAVHGTYYESWKVIKKEGLSKMTRQHIHFAKGLPGDDGVISGMRKSCQVLIYLNVPAALQDGIPLLESSNGVILSPGVNGIISPQYFEKVVDVKNGGKLQ